MPDVVRFAESMRLVLFPVAGAVRGKVRPPLVGPAEVFRGTGYLAGVVTVESAVASRPVRLYERASGVLVAETRSGTDGAYRFDGIAADREYLVLAYDDTNIHNAAPADRISPATA